MTNMYEMEGMMNRFKAEGMTDEMANMIASVTMAKLLEIPPEEAGEPVLEWLVGMDERELREATFELLNTATSMLLMLHKSGEILDQIGLT